MRIKNRFSPWFDSDLAELLHLKNCIWLKARHTYTQVDWLSFRQVRNKCTQAVRKAKVSYFKEQFALCGSNPKKFWKTVEDLENKLTSSQLHMSHKVDDVVTDKKHMAELTTSLSKESYLIQPCLLGCPTFPHLPTLLNVTIPGASPSVSPAPLQSLSLQAVTTSEV